MFYWAAIMQLTEEGVKQVVDYYVWSQSVNIGLACPFRAWILNLCSATVADKKVIARGSLRLKACDAPAETAIL